MTDTQAEAYERLAKRPRFTYKQPPERVLAPLPECTPAPVVKAKSHARAAAPVAASDALIPLTEAQISQQIADCYIGLDSKNVHPAVVHKRAHSKARHLVRP